jgi:hypothetical protein
VKKRFLLKKFPKFLLARREVTDWAGLADLAAVRQLDEVSINEIEKITGNYHSRGMLPGLVLKYRKYHFFSHNLTKSTILRLNEILEKYEVALVAYGRNTLAENESRELLRFSILRLLSEKENNILQRNRGIFARLKDLIYKVSRLLGRPILKTNTAEIIVI